MNTLGVLLLLSIAFCLTIAGVSPSARSRTKKAAAKMIAQHIETIHRRKRLILVPDDYGAITERMRKDWEKERQHLFRDVLSHEMAVMGRGRPSPRFSRQTFDRMLDRRLARYEASRPSDADSAGPVSSGIDYEHLCAALLTGAGWKTQLTKGSGDQGADIIAKRNGRRVVVQCKFYAKPVGNKAVQEVVAARQFVGADMAIVCSNQTFTPSARRLAAANSVLLLHHEQLASSLV